MNTQHDTTSAMRRRSTRPHVIRLMSLQRYLLNGWSASCAATTNASALDASPTLGAHSEDLSVQAAFVTNAVLDSHVNTTDVANIAQRIPVENDKVGGLANLN